MVGASRYRSQSKFVPLTGGAKVVNAQGSDNELVFD